MEWRSMVGQFRSIFTQWVPGFSANCSPNVLSNSTCHHSTPRSSFEYLDRRINIFILYCYYINFPYLKEPILPSFFSDICQNSRERQDVLESFCPLGLSFLSGGSEASVSSVSATSVPSAGATSLSSALARVREWGDINRWGPWGLAVLRPSLPSILCGFSLSPSPLQ
jgi:hypothetical protein